VESLPTCCGITIRHSAYAAQRQRSRTGFGSRLLVVVWYLASWKRILPFATGMWGAATSIASTLIDAETENAERGHYRCD